ncbi:MAG: PAS domain-containing protein [Dechloromonas sp.]|uniref:PAS domain-containing protein n=1 Tax=Candidatus Dechloromonas phosphorivorans TaxID=2899244 RepID=A0A935K1E2_9RHOO|nr:PAS domain-containing protein [Candidatus Dechloromonas phosphorivorans]
MRNNLPVTNVEVQLDEHTLIVSKTDLKGQITYINKDFIDISGFTELELIGQPHNLVRHPDMPVEAFADMWHDLKDGRPWTGLVKNRCKNGDYYWVLATATPMRENGQVVGYMSVRRKPTRQQVDAAESAYRLFRERKAGGLRILHGAVVKGEMGFWQSCTQVKTDGGFWCPSRGLGIDCRSWALGYGANE